MIRAQLGVDGRVGLELAVGGQPAVDLVARALVGVLAAGLQPVLAVVAIDDRARQVQLASASGPVVCGGHDQVLVGHQLVDERRRPAGRPAGWTSRTKRSAWPHISSSNTSFGRLNTSRKSSMPGPRHGVHAGERGDAARCRTSRRRPARRGSWPSDRAMYDWRRQAERLGDRDVRGVELERLDRGHRRAGDLHVERRRRAAEEDRGARPDDLGHRDPGQDVDRVEDRRPDDA